MREPRSGEREITVRTGNGLCAGILRVYESHAYEISTLPRRGVSLAGSPECANEIIRMDGTSAYGTQFHPEMSADGRRIIDAFAQLGSGAAPPDP